MTQWIQSSMDDYESTRTPSQVLYRDTPMHKKLSVLNPLAALPMRGQVKTVPSCSKKQQLRFWGLLLFNACIRSSIFIAQTGLSFGKKEVFWSVLLAFMDLWIHGFMDSWIRGFMDSWIRAFMDLWIHGFVDSWIHGFVDSAWKGWCKKLGSVSNFWTPIPVL